MEIGKLVKQHIKQIFSNCDNTDYEEIDRLLDPTYAKATFGLNFPFCIELGKIEPDQSRRYWAPIYSVADKRVRVTNHWFEKSRPLFEKYLEKNRIERAIDSPVNKIGADLANKIQHTPSPQIRYGRYKGNHIGNAQNLFIRNILSSLGDEAFNKNDWNLTMDYFSHACAYCPPEKLSNGKLIMEHSIPINKKSLGEHRLGNLVPSCERCNKLKSNKDFREFLGSNIKAIEKIEKYMHNKGYVPIDDNEQMREILNMASMEIAALMDKYIKIANDLLFPNPRK